MKKTYKIEVDCANCADKMERAADARSFLKAFLERVFPALSRF